MELLQSPQFRQQVDTFTHVRNCLHLENIRLLHSFQKRCTFECQTGASNRTDRSVAVWNQPK